MNACQMFLKTVLSVKLLEKGNFQNLDFFSEISLKKALRKDYLNLCYILNVENNMLPLKRP